MIAEPKQQPHHKDRSKRERRRDEKALDETLKNTFPASDPVSVDGHHHGSVKRQSWNTFGAVKP